MQTFGKRCQSAKRDPNCPVVIRGWLNKKVLLLRTVTNSILSKMAVWLTHHPFTHVQDSAGLKLWKRRWFVLSNYCLFYYKGNKAWIPALGFRHVLLKQHSSPPVAVFLFLLFYQPQTAERNPCWAAFPSRATRSFSAHLENARTGSSPSRYQCSEIQTQIHI